MSDKKTNSNGSKTKSSKGVTKNAVNVQKPIKRGYQPTDSFDTSNPPKPRKGTDKTK